MLDWGRPLDSSKRLCARFQIGLLRRDFLQELLNLLKLYEARTNVAGFVSIISFLDQAARLCELYPLTFFLNCHIQT